MRLNVATAMRGEQAAATAPFTTFTLHTGANSPAVRFLAVRPRTAAMTV